MKTLDLKLTRSSIAEHLLSEFVSALANFMEDVASVRSPVFYDSEVVVVLGHTSGTNNIINK